MYEKLINLSLLERFLSKIKDLLATQSENIKALSDATYPLNISIAPSYDDTATYEVDDYCIRNGTLYKCIVAVENGGEVWTAAHWAQVSVADEIGNIDVGEVIRADVTQSFTSAEKQQARENISAEAKGLRFFNTTVLASAFETNDSTTIVSDYEDYPYRASIPLTGVTSSMIPDVIFDLEDATSGVYSPISETYNGGVYIYSCEAPSDSVTIPTIVCWT